MASSPVIIITNTKCIYSTSTDNIVIVYTKLRYHRSRIQADVVDVADCGVFPVCFLHRLCGRKRKCRKTVVRRANQSIRMKSIKTISGILLHAN